MDTAEALAELDLEPLAETTRPLELADAQGSERQGSNDD
jgi:hypothetical protein